MDLPLLQLCLQGITSLLFNGFDIPFSRRPCSSVKELVRAYLLYAPLSENHPSYSFIKLLPILSRVDHTSVCCSGRCSIISDLLIPISFRFIDVPHSQYHLSSTAERLYDPDEFRISSKDVVQIHFLERSGESRSSSFG